MAVTVEQVAVRCGTTIARDEDELNRALAYAEVEVTRVFANAVSAVPDEVRDECVLRVAYSVFKKGKANDNGGMLSADGTGIPGVANDPLRTAWPLIKGYVSRV